MPAADDPTSIGNVLINLGFCQPNDIQRVLEIMTNPKRMGELLMEMEIITPPQLEWALIYQRLLRRQATVADAKAFAHKQRIMLCTELKAVRGRALALADKIKNSG